MIRHLTKEEQAKRIKEYDKWWGSLDIGDKSNIFHFCKSLLQSTNIVKATEQWKKDQRDAMFEEEL